MPTASTFASSQTEPAAQPNRGKLKIFLGYAAGVGKTYQMLEEGRALKAKGIDVVIGYFEPHGRKDTIALAEDLPMVARRAVEYRGTTFEEMDTDAILARKPQVCLVDEFPHTNIPGSARAKRWEDVQVLLEAGIDVFTTMNIQHLESLNDEVLRMTGVKVRETIPDWVVQNADEVVMVDLTPRALLNRLERGVVYPAEKVERALANFFRESTLAALREIALRQTAREVEARTSEIGTETEAEEQPASAPLAAAHTANGTRHERILIYVTSDPNTAMLIRRAKRLADYLHTNCFALTVQNGVEGGAQAEEERCAIEKHLTFARNLHIETLALTGPRVAQTIVDFARSNGFTQVYVNRPKDRHGWKLVEALVRIAKDMRIVIVAERKRTAA